MSHTSWNKFRQSFLVLLFSSPLAMWSNLLLWFINCNCVKHKLYLGGQPTNHYVSNICVSWSVTVFSLLSKSVGEPLLLFCFSSSTGQVGKLGCLLVSLWPTYMTFYKNGLFKSKLPGKDESTVKK